MTWQGSAQGYTGGKHHEALLGLADRLPQVTDKKAFIFSTYGAPEFLFAQETPRAREFIDKNHLALREKLQSKGYVIVGEFSCAGFNTNSFLKFFGGLNKGRPHAEDLRNAEAFASDLRQNIP